MLRLLIQSECRVVNICWWLSWFKSQMLWLPCYVLFWCLWSFPVIHRQVWLMNVSFLLWDRLRQWDGFLEACVTSLCIHASVNAKRANQFSVCVWAILHPLSDLNMASPLSEATGLSRKGGTSCKTNRAQLSLSPCISCSLQNGLSYFSPASDHRNLKHTGVRLNMIYMVHDVALRCL